MTQPSPLPTLSVFQAQRAQGSICCEALIERVLAGAAEKAAEHTFTRLYPQAALAAARLADANLAAGIRLTPLAGLPVSIKDLYDVAGETTMAGSLVCDGEPPALVDAPAVARLRASGAALVGKTNMTEFAFSGVGINPHFGTPRNPADPELARIPGGSSSGAAVSVALGLSVAALGSDTGGSIRVPAALCGIVGFKGTQRRVPTQGAMELSRSLDTVCAMTRSVADCLVVDGVLSGSPLMVRRRDGRSLRLAVAQTLVLDGLDPVVSLAFGRALSHLSAAGVQLVDVALPELAEVSRLNAPAGLSPIEAHAVHRDRLARGRDRFDPRVATRIELGAGVSASDYIALQDHRRAWIARVESALDGFDAVICPTVPLVAPAIEPLVRSDESFWKTNALLLRNTFAFNFLDGCAFSLPCQAAGELPVGLMLASVADDDAALAGVALVVEAVLQAAVGQPSA
jgi:aspartyl-tRNA(Asn)/glutamyl-tRNA(Gln) amidotransferase subunit A